MTADAVERAAAVLGEHAIREYDPTCSCGWQWDDREWCKAQDGPMWSWLQERPAARLTAHAAHVAQALAAADLLLTEDHGNIVEHWTRGYEHAQSEAAAGVLALREAVNDHIRRMTLFADGRAGVETGNGYALADDAFNRGIRDTLADLRESVARADRLAAQPEGEAENGGGEA